MLINPIYGTGQDARLFQSRKDEVLTLLTNVKLSELSYGIVGAGNVVPLVLTGRLDGEANIEPIRYPIFIKHREYVICVIDLREFISAKTRKIVLSEMLTNKDQGMFLIERAILSMNLYNNTKIYDTHSNIIANAMTKWVGNTLSSSMMLNVLEQGTFNIMLKGYFLHTILDGDVDELVKTRLRNEDEYFFNSAMDKFGIPKNIEELSTAISSLKPIYKGFDVVGTVPYLLGRTVYLPDSKYNTLMVLEHLPTMISVLNSGIVSKINKRNGIGKSIAKVKDISTISSLVEDSLRRGFIE